MHLVMHQGRAVWTLGSWGLASCRRPRLFSDSWCSGGPQYALARLSVCCSLLAGLRMFRGSLLSSCRGMQSLTHLPQQSPLHLKLYPSRRQSSAPQQMGARALQLWLDVA